MLRKNSQSPLINGPAIIGAGRGAPAPAGVDDAADILVVAGVGQCVELVGVPVPAGGHGGGPRLKQEIWLIDQRQADRWWN